MVPAGTGPLRDWAYLSSVETQLADANTDLAKRVTDVAHTTYARTTVNGRP